MSPLMFRGCLTTMVIRNLFLRDSSPVAKQRTIFLYQFNFPMSHMSRLGCRHDSLKPRRQPVFSVPPPPIFISTFNLNFSRSFP